MADSYQVQVAPEDLEVDEDGSGKTSGGGVDRGLPGVHNNSLEIGNEWILQEGCVVRLRMWGLRSPEGTT